MKNEKEIKRILKRWYFVINFFFPIIVFLAGSIFIYHFLNSTPPGPEIYEINWFKGGEVNNFDKYGATPAPIKRCDFKQAIKWPVQYNSVLTFESFAWRVKLRLWRPHPVFIGYWQYADTLIYFVHGLDQFHFKIDRIECQPKNKMLKISFNKHSPGFFWFLVFAWAVLIFVVRLIFLTNF